MDYDLAIVGAGWAGFNAALSAQKLGLKVCLIEKDRLGGTCLNRGCIPTKTLLQSAKIYSLTKKAAEFGIRLKEPAQVNFPEIQSRKEKIIRELESGIEFMLKGIDLFPSPCRLSSKNQLSLEGKKITAKFILIASGSQPLEIEGLNFDGKKIISSDELLEIKEVPPSLLIIGAGVVGCEFATLFSALGTQVTIVEKMPQLLPQEDQETARRLENIFKKRGIRVSTACDARTLDFKDYALVLLSIGRRPVSAGMGLEELGIKIERGAILTDPYLQTNIPGIYAAGDCTAKSMLAHFASYQGNIAVKNIARPDAPVKADDQCVPNCIFTDPQIASVGLNQGGALAKGKKIRVHKFDFQGSGMARIIDQREGFLKIISDQADGTILGANIIGPQATELIGILEVAIKQQLKADQLKGTLFAHPTLSESIAEALRD